MTQRKYLACFAASITLLLLLTACGPLKPLLSEDEVLSWLSERYETDFVIVETLKDCDFPQKDSIIRCRLYQAAPTEDLERTFWVRSTLGQYWSGDSLPMRYSQGVTDTYAFDYFLERFDALLTEHELDYCFRGHQGTVWVGFGVIRRVKLARSEGFRIVLFRICCNRCGV